MSDRYVALVEVCVSRLGWLDRGHGCLLILRVDQHEFFSFSELIDSHRDRFLCIDSESTV